MIDLRPERVGTIGTQYRFWWLPTLGYPSEAPTVTVRDTSTTLAQVLSEMTITGVDDDGVTITVSADVTASARGLIMEVGGEVWISLGAFYEGASRIRGWLTATTLELVDPIPVPAALPTSPKVIPLLMSALLPAAVTASAVLTPWSVAWTAMRGSSLPGEPRREEGLFRAARQPFRTGCTSRTLETLVPGFADITPDDQVSWDSQVQQAEDEVSRWIRQRLPAGDTEHDVNGHAFRVAHAMLTASYILLSQVALGYDRTAEAKEYRERAAALFELAISPLPWLDANRDGVVDSGEIDGRITAPSLIRAHITDTSVIADLDTYVRTSPDTRRKFGGPR